jgi:hypothetical protein
MQGVLTNAKHKLAVPEAISSKLALFVLEAFRKIPPTPFTRGSKAVYVSQREQDYATL